MKSLMQKKLPADVSLVSMVHTDTTRQHGTQQDSAKFTSKSALPGNSVMSPALWEQWQMRKHQGKTIGEISHVARAEVPASAPKGKQN